ncbi:MAG: hypothetical protein ABW128_20035, partial [Rhizorhabdus sp.]
GGTVRDPSKGFVCGACKCAVVSRLNPEPSDIVACPQCGATDRYDQFMAWTLRHAEYCLQQARAGESLPPPASAAEFKWQVKR